MTSTANAELPPPSRDDLGDNVRILEWDPPLPIASLSRRSQQLISRAGTRAAANPALDAAYAERAARLRELVRSDDLAALLGMRAGIDLLRQLPGEVSWPALAFEQDYAYADGPRARVDGARVSVLLAADGVSIRSLVSTFQPDLEPGPVNVSSEEAVSLALGATRTLGVLEPAEAMPAELVVVRAPFPFAGARRSSVVRRANDRPWHLVRLADTERATVTWEVPVDPITGEVGRPRVMSGDPGPESTYSAKETFKEVPMHFIDLWVRAAICMGLDGHGLDTYGITRAFSTTLFPEGELGDKSLNWAMVSCNEYWPRYLKAGDLITFESKPTDMPGLNLVEVFRDDDNEWFEPKASLPHAVNAQFWGERVLRYFKSRDYTKRSTGDPVRFLAQYVPYKQDYAEFSPWNGGAEPFKGNGIVRIGAPGLVFQTAADPMVLMHEFTHSLSHDMGGSPDAAQSEEYAVHEGLADCFAMLGLDAFQREAAETPTITDDLPAQYVNMGAEAPFHFWAGSYKDSNQVTRGFPNLANPYDSYGLKQNTSGVDYADYVRYTYWSAQRTLLMDNATTDKNKKENAQANELNSTLLGGVCKLLVTGGKQPHLSQTPPNAVIQTFGAGSANALGYSPSGGVDRDLGYDRLGRLLLYTFLVAKMRPKTFYDLVKVLAENIETLASTEWGGIQGGVAGLHHRLRNTFAEYGFGRIQEEEPNSKFAIDGFGDQAKRNLLATGARDFHDITGTLCKDMKDEDFFPINERVEPGDIIDFEVKELAKGVVVEVRFYGEFPCEFEEPEKLSQPCARDHQVYPQTDDNGFTPTSNAPVHKWAFPFPNGPGGGKAPWTGSGNSHKRLFVGVRLKDGPCKSTYTLHVGIQRAGKGIYP